MSDPTSHHNSDQHQDKLRDLFEQATELPPAERPAFLTSACGADTALQHELEALLAADTDASDDGFWQRSAIHNEVVEHRSASSAVGEIVGNYRLVELIGKGGMGAVYRAVRVDAGFEQSVAVKLIDAVFYSSDVIAQFRAERQILANLNHPNIARLLDGGARPDGLPYLIMEFVEGISPYEFCAQHNLSTTQRLQLFQQICSAVHSAHQNMVIHRDLKPANILVTADGTPKLLDFGIAKVLNPDPSRLDEALTRPGTLKMTARYASPEQVLGEPVTTASDVYSLGVILYELLAGHSPYGDADRPTHQIIRSVCEEEPTKPSVWVHKLKGDLDNIVLHALRKSPLDRYASADQFSEDILRYLEGRPVHARGDAPAYVAAKFIRRNRVVVIAACLILCSLIVGLVEVTLARARAERRFNDLRQLAHSVMFDYADAIDRLPGSTPVRARLVKDALTYLDNLSKEADTPQLQREIVDAYARVSDVQGNEYENNLGDTAAAMSSAHKAVEAADKLLRKDHSPPAEASAANAFSTYGSLLYSTGDLTAADLAYSRALGLYRKAADASPRSFTTQNIDNKIALAACLRHLGDLYGGYGFRNLGRTSESLASYEQARAVILALSHDLEARPPEDPELTRTTHESYVILLSLTSAENAIGKREEAAKNLEEALVQIEKASLARPSDTNVKIELAIAESRLGLMLLDNRDPTGALSHLTRSADILQHLLEADPGNAVYRRGQYIVEAQWATALRGAGQVPAALEHYERALDLARSLSKASPGAVQYRSDVGNNERKLSEGLLAAANPAAALHHAEQAQQILCHTESSTPTSPDPNGLADCGRSLLAVGNALLAAQNPRSAVTALHKAVDMASARSAADPANAIFRSDTARAQSALASALAATGDTQAAREMYQSALNTWSVLRQSNTISAEDAHRSDDTQQALAALQPHP